MKRAILLALASAAGALSLGTQALAQDQFLGQLMPVGFNFCPRYWTDANGQLLSIAQNTALFSLLGTTYGGNGIQTFALPDLRGRVASGQGNGNGLPPATQGEVLGTPTTTLLTANLPMHSHSLMASTLAPATASPTNALLGTYPTGTNVFAATPPGSPQPSTPLYGQSIGMTGGNLPFDQHQPSLVIRYCVALQGIFPSRS